MDGVIIEVGGADDIGSETLEHVASRWTELAEATEISRTAYVADGIARMAISNKNQAETCDTQGFTDLDEGLEWAKQA